MRKLSSYLRLFPAVIVLCGGLVAIKGVNLIEVARAAAPASAMPTAPGQKCSDPAVDDTTDSASEVDALTSLSRRRKELETQARELDMRANLIAAAEKRVDGKIADLKSLQSQIQVLLGDRDDAQKKQIAGLVKVYSAMKPRDAGRIFNTLDDQVLLDVAGGMKPDALAAIMAAMSPERAQALTVKLAERLNLPKAAELAPPAQAALAPVQTASAAPATASAAGTPAMGAAMTGASGATATPGK